MGRPVQLAAWAASLLVGAWLLSCCGHPRLAWRSAAPLSEVFPTPQPRDDDPAWVACHQQHVDTLRQADVAEQGYELLFFGDSITETWAGTDHCHACWPAGRCDGVPAVFAAHYAKFRPAVIAIGGDQTAHLLWRLLNGEVPQRNLPKVAVLLIGTNDLGAAVADAPGLREAEEAAERAVPGVTLRVLQTLHTLQDAMPGTHIVLMALLPRGGPGPMGPFHWPSVYTEPTEMVNAHFRSYTRLDARLHFVDCGDRFFAAGGRAIDGALMPDALHPNAAGHELLAECLDPLITRLMQQPSAAASADAADAQGEAAAVVRGAGQGREAPVARQLRSTAAAAA